MQHSRARALWITGPRRAELRDEALSAPEPDDVLVRARYGAISRGTELLVYRGEVPASEHARMRAPHQAGDFPWPLKYGYISVGRVERGPPELAGRDVFCLHPHQDRYRVTASAVVPLPEGVPPERAVLAANAETALNAIWDGALQPGARVSVVGGGTLGCLVAWLAARLPGCSVQLVDIEPERGAIAAALGVDFATPPAARDRAGLVVHTSATEAGLRTALDIAGFEATVLELSWYGTRCPTVPLGGAFHSQRLRLQSSQVGQVSPAMRAVVNHRQRLRMALELLGDPRLDVLLGGDSSFDELPRTLARLDAGESRALCERIVYD